MKKFIDWIRHSLGSPEEGARRFGPRLMAYNRLTPPAWVLKNQDPYETYYQQFYQERHLILAYGQVYWGHIIQANSALFKEGEDDHPSVVLYSTNPEMDSELGKLADLANRCFEIKKGSLSPSGSEEIHKALTSEESASSHYLLPLSVTNGLTDVYMSSMMVARKHLPCNSLESSWFPLITDQEHFKTVMFLPAAYWPEELIDLWI